ncbi:hypothetical protein [Fictibacillus phosphorivorans]|uniref:hypothetical protein n=1 Tax=Fictibacillus phosphorivorans TaxID=1221500 RepID=UPI001293D188|nr:hypothetical protein [Fictibacillus phosphorivorans]MQR94768.1 hypothetical protein [Fictibacillus phosphorivorans]
MKEFTFKQLFRELVIIKNNLGLSSFKEISDELEHFTNEYVFKFSLSKNVSLLIYSSVDKRTDYSRGYGTDAIRLVICKDNKHFLHKKLNRSDQVFSNLIKEIQKAKETFK